jgi:hypothetical protein
MIDIFKTINAARLANKNKWYFLRLDFNGSIIEIKGYNTWLQIFRINGRDYSNGMDKSVSEYKSHILNALERA